MPSASSISLPHTKSDAHLVNGELRSTKVMSAQDMDVYGAYRLVEYFNGDAADSQIITLSTTPANLLSVALYNTSSTMYEDMLREVDSFSAAVTDTFTRSGRNIYFGAGTSGSIPASRSNNIRVEYTHMGPVYETGSDGRARLLVDVSEAATITISGAVNQGNSGSQAWPVSWTNFPTVSATQNGTYSVRQVENITVSHGTNVTASLATNATVSYPAGTTLSTSPIFPAGTTLSVDVDAMSINPTVSYVAGTTLSVLGRNADSASSVDNPMPVGGKVLTSSASYTNGQNAIIQFTAEGYLKVKDQNTLSGYDSSSDLYKFDMKRVGSASISLGSNSMANSLPVVIANDQSIFTVSASPIGNYTVSHGTNVTASLATNATVSYPAGTTLSTSPVFPAGTTLSVDTELGAASASANGFANPTVPGVMSFPMGYNNNTWDRHYDAASFSLGSTTSQTSAVAVQGSDVNIGNIKSAQFYLYCTSLSADASPVFDVTLSGKDRVTGQYYSIVAFPQLTATGSKRAVVGLGVGAAVGDARSSEILPSIIRAEWKLGGTTPTVSFTVSMEGKD